MIYTKLTLGSMGDYLLIQSYKDAVRLELNIEFIMMLRNELDRRHIQINIYSTFDIDGDVNAE